LLSTPPPGASSSAQLSTLPLIFLHLHILLAPHARRCTSPRVRHVSRRRAEGDVEFKAVLFVPKTSPYEFYDKYYEKGAKGALKLYVRRVFITGANMLLCALTDCSLP
jgi:hypothetical protein